MASVYDFKLRDIDGNERSLADYRDRVLMIVNVASQCGLTPQYGGLQKLQEEYGARGLTVLGFPCNQFAGQEPGSEAQIKTFCETSFGTTFPLFAKIDVNGANRSPLYAWLTQQATSPDGPGDIQWNFAKFLIDRKGGVAARFAPPTAPEDATVKSAVESALG